MSDKLDACNEVLGIFAPDTRIEHERQRWWVTWQVRGESITKQWQTRGQDFYPVWHRKWAHGGTACTALSQLIRWLQERPVLPLATWRYWGGETISLGRARGPEMAVILEAAGYQSEVPCVLCGQPLTVAGDWWSLHGVSGPCCSLRSGCMQRRAIP